MTETLFRETGKAFISDSCEIHAVAIDKADKVYVLATIHGEYYPKAPAGQRYGGWQQSGLFELRDTGKGYCDMPVVGKHCYRQLWLAREAFNQFTDGMAQARNQHELEEIMSPILITDDEQAAVSA